MALCGKLGAGKGRFLTYHSWGIYILHKSGHLGQVRMRLNLFWTLSIGLESDPFFVASFKWTRSFWLPWRWGGAGDIFSIERFFLGYWLWVCFLSIFLVNSLKGVYTFENYQLVYVIMTPHRNNMSIDNLPLKSYTKLVFTQCFSFTLRFLKQRFSLTLSLNG